MTLETRDDPPAVTTIVETTQDAARLDGWLEAILEARFIRDVGISSTK